MSNQPDTPAEADAAPPPLNWAILGAARIARKLVPSMRAAGDRVAAVGASTRERANAFARELEIPHAVDGYQPAIDCPQVDAIYLPLANGLHFRWALACARAGKPCLCEKPLVLSAEEAEQLRAAFNQAGVRLMEAFMWRHHPQTAWVLRRLQETEIGEVRRINAAFSIPLELSGNYRWGDEQGGGSLCDVGAYCVDAMRLFMGQEPRAVSAHSALVEGTQSADRSTAGWLDFGGDRLASFQSSFTSVYHQHLSIVGTRGVIEIERPFIGILDAPTRSRVIRDGETKIETFAPDNAYIHMIAHFRRAVHDRSFALTPAEDGCAQAAVMQALGESRRQGAVRPVTQS